MVAEGFDVEVSNTFTGKAAPWIDGAVMPVAWKKLYGKGRVFHATLGHVAADFKGPETENGARHHFEPGTSSTVGWPGTAPTDRAR
jgi:type 1 glutamine amidotransferase